MDTYKYLSTYTRVYLRLLKYLYEYLYLGILTIISI